jgi:hypothetical protein
MNSVPFVGKLESTGARLTRTGERAFRVAEEFCFRQSLGDGGGIERDEVLIAP